MTIKPNPAFLLKLKLSDELIAITGKDYIARTDVVKKVWAYIKEHDLQDAKNRRNIHSDEKLLKIFGGKQIVSMFEMNKLINKHLTIPEDSDLSYKEDYEETRDKKPNRRNGTNVEVLSTELLNKMESVDQALEELENINSSIGNLDFEVLANDVESIREDVAEINCKVSELSEQISELRELFLRKI